MAAISVTISSSIVGMLTSSYNLDDDDLNRVLNMLRDQYSQPPEEGEETQSYTNQQLVEQLTYYFLSGLSEKVKNYEFKVEVEKIKAKLSPIDFNKAM